MATVTPRTPSHRIDPVDMTGHHIGRTVTITIPPGWQFTETIVNIEHAGLADQALCDKSPTYAPVTTLTTLSEDGTLRTFDPTPETTIEVHDEIRHM